MSWTTPKTWAYKEILSSSDLNTYVSDNMNDHQDRINTLEIATLGWVDADETWTCSSDNVITVPSDATVKYSIGDKLKLTDDGTVIYAYVVAVAATTLTVRCNTASRTEVTLASGSTITEPKFSKAQSPVGFPGEFAYDPGFAGKIGGSIVSGSFSMQGSDMRVNIQANYGAGSTLGASTGWNLPAYPTNTVTSVGTLFHYTGGASGWKVGVWRLSATENSMSLDGANGNCPIGFTWATNSQLRVSVIYSVA